MKNRIAIFICKHFRAELDNVIKQNNYENIHAFSFQARCGHPPISRDEILDQNFNFDDYDKICVIGGCCLSEISSELSEQSNFEIVKQDQCFFMFANNEFLLSFQKEGNYLITPGWLNNWEEKISVWGFDKESAREFFNSSMKGLILLDTGISTKSKEKLNELSEYVSLPASILPIGLDYFGLFINNILARMAKKTYKKSKKAFLRHLSEYGIAFDFFDSLKGIVGERNTLQKIMELFEMLFASQTLTLVRIPDNINDVEKLMISNSSEDKEGLYERIILLEKDYGWTDTNDGFYLKFNDDRFQYIIEIGKIPFPEYKEHYLNLALSVSKVCGIAISKARGYELLNQRNDELIEINAEKDKFISIISHDLKAPFVGLLGVGEVLIEDWEDFSPIERKQLITELFDQSKKTFELLKGLLEWANIQRMEKDIAPVEIDFSIMGSEIIDLLKINATKKQIKLLSEIKKDIVGIGDKFMIQTVLRNLVSNAIKFTPNGGEIVIKGEKEEKYVKIIVEDSGIGISEENIAKLFRLDIHHTTEGTNKESGTGLGLILCKEFIDINKGEIWVESILGKGSKFIFILPRKMG